MRASGFHALNGSHTGIPVFTTRSMSVPSGASTTQAELSHTNPFSFFSAAQERKHLEGSTTPCASTPGSPQPSQAPLTVESLVPEPTAATGKGVPHSATRCSSLSRSVSSFAISLTSEYCPSTASTRADSPIPQVASENQSFPLCVVSPVAKGTIVAPGPAVSSPVAPLSAQRTAQGAKTLFRLLANQRDENAAIHADDVMDVYIATKTPWFTAGTLIVALCLINRYTVAFPHWYDCNTSAVENAQSRQRTSGTVAAAGSPLTKQSAARTLLAALQSATKFYADTTYKNDSLCRVWNDRRADLSAEDLKTSAMSTKLTSSRLAASEWRLMEELGFSAWVEADEYNRCLQHVALCA